MAVDGWFGSTMLLLNGEQANGTTSVTAPPMQYVLTGTNGAQVRTDGPKRFGSGAWFFDGIDDYIDIPGDSWFQPGTGNFTVEAWVYVPDSLPGVSWMKDMTVFGGYGPTTPLFYVDAITGCPRMWDGTNNVNSNIPITVNAWTHIAWQRTNGVLYIFTNGVLGNPGGTAWALNWNFNPTKYRIGGNSINDGLRYFKGLIDDLRFTFGNNRGYGPSDFTAPTIALPDNGTVGLWKFNGNASDPHVGSYFTATTGSPSYDSAVKKFGTHSLYLNGSSCLRGGWADAKYAFLDEDFTYEMWVNFKAYPKPEKWMMLLSQWEDQGGNNHRSFYVGLRNTYGTLKLGVGASTNGTGNYTGSPFFYDWIPSLNTWYHIAVTRKSGFIRAFIDGTKVIEQAIAGSLYYSSTYGLVVGAYSQTAPLGFLEGWIDDLRITRRLARYE